MKQIQHITEITELLFKFSSKKDDEIIPGIIKELKKVSNYGKYFCLELQTHVIIRDNAQNLEEKKETIKQLKTANSKLGELIKNLPNSLQEKESQEAFDRDLNKLLFTIYDPNQHF